MFYLHPLWHHDGWSSTNQSSSLSLSSLMHTRSRNSSIYFIISLSLSLSFCHTDSFCLTLQLTFFPLSFMNTLTHLTCSHSLSLHFTLKHTLDISLSLSHTRTLSLHRSCASQDVQSIFPAKSESIIQHRSEAEIIETQKNVLSFSIFILCL